MYPIIAKLSHNTIQNIDQKLDQKQIYRSKSETRWTDQRQDKNESTDEKVGWGILNAFIYII